MLDASTGGADKDPESGVQVRVTVLRERERERKKTLVCIENSRSAPPIGVKNDDDDVRNTAR